jgi:phage tail sheath gpL-like
MPTITFTEASGGPVPAVEIEINLQGAGGLPSGEQIRSIMVVAERVAAGTLAADTLSSTAFADADAAIAAFGANSPGAHMCAAIFDYNNSQTGSGRPKCEVWGGAVAEKATGTAAVQTLTFAAGPATSAGTWIFSIGGKQLSVNVAVGDVIADMKTAVIAAWDALAQKDRCPVLMTDGGGGVVTITASVKGTHLNNIGLETIQDPNCGITDAFSGTTMGAAGGTPGAGPHATADFDNIIAALGSFYDAGQIVIPWTEAGNAAGQVFNPTAPDDFRDHVISMGDATNMVPSSLRMAYKSTTTILNAAVAALDTDDCERVSLVGAPYSTTGGSGSWEGEIAARYAAMRATQTHLGRSFNGLYFKEVETPNAADNWTKTEQKTLIEGGVSPVAVPVGGDTITMVRDVACRTNFGVLDTNVMDVLDYIREDFRAALVAEPRLSIVDDDAEKPPVDFITSPRQIRGLLRSRADLLEQAGYMTNVETNWPNVVTNLSGSTLQLSIPVSLIPALHNIMVRLDAAVPPGA